MVSRVLSQPIVSEIEPQLQQVEEIYNEASTLLEAARIAHQTFKKSLSDLITHFDSMDHCIQELSGCSIESESFCESSDEDLSETQSYFETETQKKSLIDSDVVMMKKVALDSDSEVSEQEISSDSEMEIGKKSLTDSDIALLQGFESELDIQEEDENDGNLATSATKLHTSVLSLNLHAVGQRVDEIAEILAKSVQKIRPFP